MASSSVDYKGKRYKSLKHLAETFNIHHKSLYARLDKGLSLEEAIMYEYTKYVITYKGVKYLNLKELTQSLGLSYELICKRIHDGMSLEEALTKPIKNREVVVNNRIFKNVHDVVNFYGIDYSLVNNRLTMGMSLQEAIDDMLLKEKISFDDVEYNSLTSLCNAYSIATVTVNSRLKRGWTLRDTLTKPIKVVNAKETYLFRGKVYNSQRAMTDAHGVQISFVKTFAKIHSLHIVEALDILVAFLSYYKGEKPNLISQIPVVIYNSIWYDTFKNLYIDLGTNNMEVKAFMTAHKIRSNFDALAEMRLLTVEKYVDNQTNTVISQKEIRKKYRAHVDNAEIRGQVRKEIFKRYPNLCFNPTGYCATPKADFDIFIKSHMESFKR